VIEKQSAYVLIHVEAWFVYELVLTAVYTRQQLICGLVSMIVLHTAPFTDPQVVPRDEILFLKQIATSCA